MGLDDLKPRDTKRARATAVKAFARFIQSEDVDLDYVRSYNLHDASGQCFVSVMDKFGMYFAFHEGTSGKPRARHSCMQYHRQAKHWLLDQFPHHQASLEAWLLKMGRTLENYCVKREGGGFVKKAIACTMSDLRRKVYYLYANACSSSDYQDAALLSLLWYMFGRASDLTLVRKQNVSIDAGNVFFVRFISVKTCEEQGPSLFPDADFVTCRCTRSHWRSSPRHLQVPTSSTTSLPSSQRKRRTPPGDAAHRPPRPPRRHCRTPRTARHRHRQFSNSSHPRQPPPRSCCNARRRRAAADVPFVSPRRTAAREQLLPAHRPLDL